MSPEDYTMFLDRLHPELNKAKRAGQGKQVQSVSLYRIVEPRQLLMPARSSARWNSVWAHLLDLRVLRPAPTLPAGISPGASLRRL